MGEELFTCLLKEDLDKQASEKHRINAPMNAIGRPLGSQLIYLYLGYLGSA